MEPAHRRSYIFYDSFFGLTPERIHYEKDFYAETNRTRTTGDRSRRLLQTRVGILPYRQFSPDQPSTPFPHLYVSAFRYWVSDGNVLRPEEAQLTNVEFTLEEGPGLSLRAAMEGQPNPVYHYELPSLPPRPLPPTLTPDWEHYLSEFTQKSHIPRNKIRRFQRHSHFYLYYPLHYGNQQREPYAYRTFLIPPDFVVGGMIVEKQVGWFN